MSLWRVYEAARVKVVAAARADLDALIAQATTKRTARAWLYKEQLREMLERKQINVVRDMLRPDFDTAK